MTTLIASATAPPDDDRDPITTFTDAPNWKALEKALEVPLPETRGTCPTTIKVALGGQVENPPDYVRRVHEGRHDEDVAGALEQAEQGCATLDAHVASAERDIAAYDARLKGEDRHEHVAADAKTWTGFERFWVVSACVLSLTLLVASVVQLAQLLVQGGYVDGLAVGLRFGFIPLVAVAGLEIVGHKILLGSRAKRYYCGALAAVCLFAGISWAGLFLGEYGTVMSSGGQVNLEELLRIDLNPAPAAPAAPAEKEGAPLVLLASVIAEIFGASLIWLVLAFEFEAHAPWTLGVKRFVRSLERERCALVEGKKEAADLLSRYVGRRNKLRLGRKNTADEAVNEFLERLGKRDRTSGAVAEVDAARAHKDIPNRLAERRGDIFNPSNNGSNSHA